MFLAMLAQSAVNVAVPSWITALVGGSPVAGVILVFMVWMRQDNNKREADHRKDWAQLHAEYMEDIKAKRKSMEDLTGRTLDVIDANTRAQATMVESLKHCPNWNGNALPKQGG